MKLVKLITLFFLLILPQVQQAWGASHCVTDCHEKEATHHQLEETHQESAPEKEQSHQHTHHCSHSFALVVNFASLQNPLSEYKELVYHFTFYESEPHLYLFIEPPIQSSLTFT